MAVVKLKPREAECDLPVEINAAHDAAVKAIAQGTAHAIRAGELLLAAKAKIGHGQWAKWQKANLSFSARTAQTYMQLARLDPQKRNAVADLTLRRAVLKIQADERDRRELERRLAEQNAAAQTKQDEEEQILSAVTWQGPPQGSAPTLFPDPEPTLDDIAGDLIDQLALAAHEAGLNRDVLVEALCRAFGLRVS